METDLLELWQSCFGESDGFWQLFRDNGFRPEQVCEIRRDGRLAAALYWFPISCEGQNLAYLYAVATHPDFRGRGLCRELMAKTEIMLAGKGISGVLLVPESHSLRQMYGKMGYTDCTTVSEFSCGAGESAIPLGSVTTEEYALLRKKRLPPGGVLQEGDSLTFLAAQAQLYAGENLLMAAWQEADTLHAMELLGDSSTAPGILKALGFQKGTFRTPGADKEFAMFKPLREEAIRPTYFGLAFD